jgi:hypothetical protein
MGSRKKHKESSNSWEGQDELRHALDDLVGPKGTSANRVKAAATASLLYIKVSVLYTCLYFDVYFIISLPFCLGL